MITLERSYLDRYVGARDINRASTYLSRLRADTVSAPRGRKGHEMLHWIPDCLIHLENLDPLKVRKQIELTVLREHNVEPGENSKRQLRSNNPDVVACGLRHLRRQCVRAVAYEMTNRGEPQSPFQQLFDDLDRRHAGRVLHSISPSRESVNHILCVVLPKMRA